MKSILLSIVIASVFCLQSVSAGSLSFSDTVNSCGYLTVRSEQENVMVYCDTALLGTAPISNIEIEKGLRVFRFVQSQGKKWYSPSIVETVDVHSQEEIIRDVIFPSLCRITSEPDGAVVMVGDSVVGTTPLLFSSSFNNSMVTISRDGFEPAALPLADNLHAVLNPMAGVLPPEVSPYLSFEQSESSTPIYMAAGATVLTGAAAAYFKIKADTYYSEYRRTGDSASLDKVHTMDVLSGISLVASELGLFMLTYHLLSR